MTAAAALDRPSDEVEYRCGCPGCAADLDPWSVDHFERWAYELVLDNGEQWRVPGYFLAFVEDLYEGLPETPRFREGWLVVPEGNAKTTSLAGLAIHHVEHTPTASVPWAASSREQAEIGYRQGEGFILRTPRLLRLFKAQEGYRRIKRLADGGRIQVFAADDRTGDGIIPGRLAILDELHRQRDLRLYRTWYGKLDKRNAQLAALSTAGEPGTEFEDAREKMRTEAEEIERDGAFTRAVKSGSVIHDWAVPEGADVYDLDAVKSASPFDGITIESLAVKRDSPTMTLAHWRRFVCNLATRSENAAITEGEWLAARTEETIPDGVPIWAGLDVAWKWDTTALVPLWPRDAKFRLLGDATILTPPRDGTALDPKLVEHAVLEMHRRNPIHTIVMDTHRAEQLADWIAEATGAEVIDRQQTPSLQVADYERFMEALREGWLWHTGHGGLTRHVLNAVSKVLPRGDAVFERPHKGQRSAEQDRRVIDALVAGAMAHSLYVAELREEPEVASSWRPL